MLLNLICNIALPVFILNRFSVPWGPALALVVALAFPLSYGAYDLYRRKKTNIMSVLGLLNILVTGGLALLGVTGFWFAVKEAAFPALIGAFVLASAWTKKPAVEMLFLNPTFFHLDRIQAKVDDKGAHDSFHLLLVGSTKWLAISFFLSAAMNFALALRIFKPMPEQMEASAVRILLNEQLAQMHQWSFLVILAPSMMFLMAIFYFMIKKIRDLTGLTDDEIFREK